MSFHSPSRTSPALIINLSYGPTTGPHDGLALLESLDRSCCRVRWHWRKPKLEIALAAGNSYLTEGHVVFRRHHTIMTTSNGPGAFLLTTPCFASPKCG